MPLTPSDTVTYAVTYWLARRGMSIREAARQANREYAWLQRRTSRSVPWSVDDVALIASVLSVTPSELYGHVDQLSA
jgi:lambda repressor-like predicted transcriptional regulator